jgi:hypothetical protein
MRAVIIVTTPFQRVLSDAGCEWKESNLLPISIALGYWKSSRTDNSSDLKEEGATAFDLNIVDINAGLDEDTETLKEIAKWIGNGMKGEGNLPTVRKFSITDIPDSIGVPLQGKLKSKGYQRKKGKRIRYNNPRR